MLGSAMQQSSRRSALFRLRLFRLTPFRLTLCACVALVLWVGCSSASGPAASRASTDASIEAGIDAAISNAPLPSAVDSVFASRCRKCHGTPQHMGAPFPLLTWQNTQMLVPNNPRHLHVYEAMKLRINDPNFPMPPDGNPFTASDRKVLNDWLDAGAPPGP